MTRVWYPVTNKMSWRQWNNKHHYILGTAHRDSLKTNIQHSAVFKMMVLPFISINLFTAEYFLAHWLIITCWNEQTQQSICQRMTMYLYLQFITDSTDHIRHTSRKWNLQPVTSSATQCNAVCIRLRWSGCVVLVHLIYREWCRNDGC